MEVKDVIDLVDKPHSRCLNSSCPGNSTIMIAAADFCLSYYRVKRSNNHKEEICEDCYNKAVEDFDRLSLKLKSGGLLLTEKYPIINETLQIDDSDEEDSDNEGSMEYIDQENFEFIAKNFDQIFDETLEKFKLEKQYQLEAEYLKEENKKVEEKCTELTNDVKNIRTMLDGIQLNLYNYFRPDFCNLKGLTIVDDCSLSANMFIKSDSEPARKSTRSQNKPISYVELDDASNSPKIAPPVAKQGAASSESKTSGVQPPPDLPPLLSIEKPELKVGELYYIARENAQGNWVRARLTQIINPVPSNMGVCYKMTELKQQKERFVNGRSVAYLNASKVRLPVGTRVISEFKETTGFGEKKPKHNLYYAGIVAEQPFEGNNFRYLIFFDIGYSQYVSYHSVNLVYESSPKVWEDVLIDSRPFIKKYLESQDRPMVKLAKDQTVRVEYNGKWWLCTVIKVDCSLVQVFFDSLSRTEWIYRGSTRLSPMFREEQAATNRHTGLRTSRKAGPNESMTVVQYTRHNNFLQSGDSQDQKHQTSDPEKAPERIDLEADEAPVEHTSNVRAVARKSTTRPQLSNTPAQNIVPFLPPVSNNTISSSGPTSKIMYFTPHEKVIIKRTYTPHDCSPQCKEYLTHNFNQLRGHNPLSKPLLCGWGRMTQKAKSGNKKEIVYKAPCGRLLRNIAEVHYYLRLTESEMTVDLFDFNHMVRCLAEFAVECNPDPKDLSKGLEQVPIPVINGINNEMLDFCNYSIKRVPMEGVNLNLDPEFLCGCNCEDNCIDKTKCACWKMTMEGAKYIGKDVDPNSIGYIYRRLPEQVITGIYECNSRCKCSSTCLNRVVQNPMSLKLQVFKTHNRGWGIRCLNDIPQGTFICIYAGTLHTEAMANQDGMAYGDEYFAELDYIETVEKYKEDYEAEVMEDEDYREKSPIEEEEEEETKKSKKRNSYTIDNDFSLPIKVDVKQTSREGIRTRLRARNIDDDKTEPNETKEQEKPKVKEEPKLTVDQLSGSIETVTISDEEDEGREVLNFDSKAKGLDDKSLRYTSVREVFGEDECVYVMDAKNTGNIGRFLNHSCSPNIFVQNVFVDTHDPRFPWVAFFSSQFIRAGTELTWNYNYDIGSVPNRVLYCLCASLECKGRLL
ncbi:unnamed protein product [Acanthoscelides obtectus]|nr:unnamed protein product [Acanthoscelides obtectus]CAK1658326.1 Histone-lysine N-methyltransferase eggless [Acanthoscelides obtectus]